MKKSVHLYKNTHTYTLEIIFFYLLQIRLHNIDCKNLNFIIHIYLKIKGLKLIL